jgi:hypothetical protein
MLPWFVMLSFSFIRRSHCGFHCCVQGKPPKWKKLLTKLQILQFAAGVPGSITQHFARSFMCARLCLGGKVVRVEGEGGGSLVELYSLGDGGMHVGVPFVTTQQLCVCVGALVCTHIHTHTHIYMHTPTSMHTQKARFGTVRSSSRSPLCPSGERSSPSLSTPPAAGYTHTHTHAHTHMHIPTHAHTRT